ncbi:MAG TPA: hypothetical protein PKC21_06945 [Oligoflexia bacterium]|nr:hypothetical protein [Oligoflexia bacterium]HMR25074.1 hypothetical protein [Oligoflexia bacterium]
MKHYLKLLCLAIGCLNLTQNALAQNLLPLLNSGDLEILISPDQNKIIINGKVITEGIYKDLLNQEEIPSTLEKNYNNNDFYQNRTLDDHVIEYLQKRPSYVEDPSMPFFQEQAIYYNTQNGCITIVVYDGMQKVQCRYLESLIHINQKHKDQVISRMFEMLYEGSYEYCPDPV